MGEGSGFPGPHGGYLTGRWTDVEKTPQRKRDAKKSASEGGFQGYFRSSCSASSAAAKVRMDARTQQERRKLGDTLRAGGAGAGVAELHPAALDDVAICSEACSVSMASSVASSMKMPRTLPPPRVVAQSAVGDDGTAAGTHLPRHLQRGIVLARRPRGTLCGVSGVLLRRVGEQATPRRRSSPSVQEASVHPVVDGSQASVDEGGLLGRHAMIPDWGRHHAAWHPG